MKATTFIFCCLLAIGIPACSPDYKLSADRGRAEYVVLMVWDGLRPDLVSEEDTPTLWKMGGKGVTFANHHPVYPSTTEVNGTALATGGTPAHSGIIGNHEFRPAIDPRKPIGTEDLEAVRKGDDITGGKYLGLSTVAELVQQAGFRTAVAGTKPVALLANRTHTGTPKGARGSATVFGGKAIPAARLGEITKSQGDFPKMITIPNNDQDLWTASALINELWKEGVPKFSVLWMSDPDFSQHAHAPGAPLAREAMKRSDEKLAMVLAALDAKGIREKTDVLVVSDHGFSTISNVVDIVEELSEAGLSVSRQFATAPQTGHILLVNTGATLFFYVTGHDSATVARLVDHLQRAPYSGVIFTREAQEGTFPLSAAHIDSADAPDVVLSMRWSDEQNKYGIPGMLWMEAPRKVGTGMHGTLSPFDMHNTLIAAGPDFPEGTVEKLPTGNVDVAPTILWILGIRPAQPLDGRVLVGKGAASAVEEIPPMEATRDLGTGKWRQYLRQVRCGNTTYFLEGNGKQGE